MNITVTIYSGGMGDGATEADYDAYAAYCQQRLADMYPTHDVSVEQGEWGADGSTRVRCMSATDWDPQLEQQVGDALTVIWDAFCRDTSLWPSTVNA